LKTRHANKKLEEAFDQAVENFLKVILEELVVSAATMTTGASVSSVMAPVIPALKAVGTAIEALNDGLDFLS